MNKAIRRQEMNLFIIQQTRFVFFLLCANCSLRPVRIIQHVLSRKAFSPQIKQFNSFPLSLHFLSRLVRPHVLFYFSLSHSLSLSVSKLSTYATAVQKWEIYFLCLCFSFHFYLTERGSSSPRHSQIHMEKNMEKSCCKVMK